MQWSLYFKIICISVLLHSSSVESDSIANFTKPNPLPKYFAIDVDGTFYTKDEAVFQKNVEALKKLKDNNITPFFCTGRDPESVEFMFTDDFKNTTNYKGYPGIYGNGSLAFDSNGTIIKLVKFSEEWLTKFKTYADSKSITNLIVFLTDQGRFSLTDLSEDTKKYIRDKNYKDPVQTTFDDLKKRNVVSILVNRSEISDFNSLNETSYFNSKSNRFQMSPKDCNKKTALEALLTHLNSKADECVHIGDNVNDREAMEFCGLSFAVGDADDETKQKAKWVLDVNHDQGAFEKAVKLLCDD